ncbi:MAG: DNA cytosine methyltransferase, partial [Sphingobacteriales bacterium]
NNKRVFKIALSIEKDPLAHQTLMLRSFFRQFSFEDVPNDYYNFIRGEITIKELYERWPTQAAYAKQETWCGTLGDPEEHDLNAVTDHEVDERIREVLNGKTNWLLIGGPPCQAYSIVGRSRRQEKVLNEQTDKRVGLYKQYLRILAVHSPAIFVMENVKGILSAETSENQVFSKILNDLSDPASSYLADNDVAGDNIQYPSYRIYSLVNTPDQIDIYGNPEYQHKKFVIKAEEHGVPQTRHRVILLGIRSDIDVVPDIIHRQAEIPVSDIINDLPALRSTLSKSENNFTDWKNVIRKIFDGDTLSGLDAEMKSAINSFVDNMEEPTFGIGANFLATDKAGINYRPEWYLDQKIKGVLNHSSRAHMDSDLHRYLFASSFGKVRGVSPKLSDFPLQLLPAHGNVRQGIEEKKFADRFRVQLAEKASKTITSHISKDGHYYIHPDPKQCRSLTVREAARLQTFPDNYFFCGPRTSQFHQVGNAVPPYLAYQIASVVNQVFEQVYEDIAIALAN